MYKHVGTSFTFETPDGKKVYIRMIPGTDPGTCKLVYTNQNDETSSREIVHTAGAADLQIQSGVKWAGEQVWAAILETEITKQTKKHES